MHPLISQDWHQISQILIMSGHWDRLLANRIPPDPWGEENPLSQVIIWPLNAHHNAHVHVHREVTGNTFSHSKSPMTLVSPVFPLLSTLTSFKNPVCVIIIVFKAHNSFCYQFQNFANLCQYFHVPYSIHNLHHNLLWHNFVCFYSCIRLLVFRRINFLIQILPVCPVFSCLVCHSPYFTVLNYLQVQEHRVPAA